MRFSNKVIRFRQAGVLCKSASFAENLAGTSPILQSSDVMRVLKVVTLLSEVNGLNCSRSEVWSKGGAS